MVFKIIHVILLAAVKYILTLPYALMIGLEYEQAIIAVLAGGIGGFLFFYYLSKPFIRALDALWPHLQHRIPGSVCNFYRRLFKRKNIPRKIKRFTRRNRFLIRFRTTYGFWGIIIMTPFLLTIPLGAFLAEKYYSKRKHLVLFMILSIIAWAAILSAAIHLFPGIFFD